MITHNPPPIRICSCGNRLHRLSKHARCLRCRSVERVPGKVGRRKKLTHAQAAALFQLQTERAGLDRQIRKLLEEAGFVTAGNRSRVSALNWLDRGRVDIVHKTGETMEQARTAAGARIARLRLQHD